MPIIEVNTFDCDLCVADTFPVELTAEQISDIVSHATQVVVAHRAHQVLDGIDELYEALCAAGILIDS